MKQVTSTGHCLSWISVESIKIHDNSCTWRSKFIVLHPMKKRERSIDQQVGIVSKQLQYLVPLFLPWLALYDSRTYHWCLLCLSKRKQKGMDIEVLSSTWRNRSYDPRIGFLREREHRRWKLETEWPFFRRTKTRSGRSFHAKIRIFLCECIVSTTPSCKRTKYNNPNRTRGLCWAWWCLSSTFSFCQKTNALGLVFLLTILPHKNNFNT